MRPWTAEDKQKLRKNYGRMPAWELAEILDRTVDSVWRMACRMGIRKVEPAHTPTHGLWNVVFETRAYL